ncbi:MAG: hypothetical protein IJ730_04235 [Alphaproteobacteria bacterium]|nr:hypothetical protein [Alphaproteobacteria bacterium]
MIDLDKLTEDWPSPFVARTEIEKFTKGMYKKSSMNVFDTMGKGIKRRIKIGEKVGYLASDVVSWIKEKKNGKNSVR